MTEQQPNQAADSTTNTNTTKNTTPAGQPTNSARRPRTRAQRPPVSKTANGTLSSGTSGAANAANAANAADAAPPFPPEEVVDAATTSQRDASVQPKTPRASKGGGGISPENTVFVSLCFEGPDIYSTAGGLGTRVAEFTESLAQLGYDTHLIFVGDPNKPASEELEHGRLHLRRWSQWISQHYPNGVYDGEEHKIYDYNETVPFYVYDQIVRPAVEQGKIVVIIGEDWHTAEAIIRTSDMLHWHNLRHRCIMMWNCNSLMSLNRINWEKLNFTSAITTVSRYMKHRLWDYHVNALTIPNGIPPRYLETVSAKSVRALRTAAQRGNPDRLVLFKIGRFDPDKRWLMAVEAVSRLKYSGHPITMMIRGGIEPHGGEVLNRARHLGLNVLDIEARRPTVEECVKLIRDADEADIYNLRFFVPEEFVRMSYAAADAVLANSGHEPFGLVGLEVMAARGIAFTGSTGEDYAVSFENAVALETEDPDEIVGYLLHLLRHPEEKEKIRAAGWQTAAEFTWPEAIENLAGKLGYLARKQSIVLE